MIRGNLLQKSEIAYSKAIGKACGPEIVPIGGTP